jgi:hypothetical protein
MKNPIYFLQKNIGILPLTGALIGGAVGFGVGSTGRLAVDSISFLYDTAAYVARNFPYNLQINPGFISSLVTDAERSLEHALYDGMETSAVYSAGSLLLTKKILGIFRTKKGGERNG